MQLSVHLVKCLYQMGVHLSFEPAEIQVPIFLCFSEWPMTNHLNYPACAKQKTWASGLQWKHYSPEEVVLGTL